MSTQTFNVLMGGRYWHSETELVNELNRTIDLHVAKYGLDRERVIDAAQQWHASDALTSSPWEILATAVGTASDLGRKKDSMTVRIYLGIRDAAPAPGSCERCGGTGYYQFSNGSKGVCFGCSGSGRESRQ
jgi:hypothetical protein